MAMSAGFTIVSYGNITLYRCTTEDVTQELVFDDSRTDMLYVKTKIRISGFVHGHQNWNYQVVNDATGINYAGSAGAAEIGVRRRLEPREAFRMWTGCTGEGQLPDGQLLFDVAPFPLNVIVPSPPRVVGNVDLVGYDLNNGPKNLDLSIHQIAGDELFRVTATFELCHLECAYNPGDKPNSYGVLSNRWTCVDSLDNNLQVTRTYAGTLVCATQNINMQSFRWMTVPTIQPLMRIESMNFESSLDGLKLNWVVVHKEIALSAPWPARTWSVTHREEQEGGIKATCYIDVDLTGDSQVDKSRLITLAYWIIFAKSFRITPKSLLDTPNNVDGVLPPGSTPRTRRMSPFLVQRVTFTDHIGDVNRITASAVVQRVSKDAADDIILSFNGLGQIMTQNDLPQPQGKEPPYQSAKSWGAYSGQIPEFSGPATVAGVFACFLQTPRDDNHSLYKPPS